MSMEGSGNTGDLAAMEGRKKAGVADLLLDAMLLIEWDDGAEKALLVTVTSGLDGGSA